MVFRIGMACAMVVCGLWANPSAIGKEPAPSKAAAVKPIGDDLSAWRTPTGAWAVVGKAIMPPTDPSKIAVEPGTGVLYNGPQGRTNNLFTKAEFGDVKAHIEFMVPKGSNSGVYFQGRYEVQILDSWGVENPKFGDCGGIYQRWIDGKGFEGRPPRVNASKAPGQWQSFDVVFRAPRFDQSGKKIENARFVKVIHNGVVVHENVEVTGPTRAAAFSDEKPTGPLMLQGDHGPVAYRNIRIVPIELP
ncbi:DUF1080 domain-containing protein [Thermostilla marina]